MKTTEKVTEPPRVREVHSYTCDKCGLPCGPYDRRGYDVNEVAMMSMAKVHMREGSDFGYTALIQRTEVDCCTECFVEHVIPALIALGFKPRIESEHR